MIQPPRNSWEQSFLFAKSNCKEPHFQLYQTMLWPQRRLVTPFFPSSPSQPPVTLPSCPPVSPPSTAPFPACFKPNCPPCSSPCLSFPFLSSISLWLSSSFLFQFILHFILMSLLLPPLNPACSCCVCKQAQCLPHPLNPVDSPGTGPESEMCPFVLWKTFMVRN